MQRTMPRSRKQLLWRTLRRRPTQRRTLRPSRTRAATERTPSRTRRGRMRASGRSWSTRTATATDSARAVRSKFAAVTLCHRALRFVTATATTWIRAFSQVPRSTAMASTATAMARAPIEQPLRSSLRCRRATTRTSTARPSARASVFGTSRPGATTRVARIADSSRFRRSATLGCSCAKPAVRKTAANAHAGLIRPTAAACRSRARTTADNGFNSAPRSSARGTAQHLAQLTAGHRITRGTPRSSRREPGSGSCASTRRGSRRSASAVSA